jgi:protein phosphatase
MEFCAKTDKGRCRNINQDTIFASKSSVGVLPNLFIVADGMGGHLAGDYASAYAVRRIKELIEESESENVVSTLKEVITQVNEELYHIGQTESKYYGMGTTLVLCCVTGKLLTIANVGDSRLYLYTNRQIRQITRDHSLVAALVALGELEVDSEIYNQNKNIITRAVGVENSIDIDMFQLQLKKGIQILLCSDGLTNMVDDQRILDILNENETLEDSVTKLIEVANDNGGQDNISVIAVDPQLS